MEKQYLYIFEDGSVKTSRSVNDEDLKSTDDGYLEIIDITNPKEPLWHNAGDWLNIEIIEVLQETL